MVDLTEANLSSAIPILPTDKSIGELEIVTLFEEVMPICLVVSKQGHIFVICPRLVDNVEFTVARLTHPHQKNGLPVPYPNAEVCRQDAAPPSERLLKVQGMTLDAHDRLWLPGHAKIKQNLVPLDRPKLVGIDRQIKQMIKKILSALRHSLMNRYRTIKLPQRSLIMATFTSP